MKLQISIGGWRYLYNDSYAFQASVVEVFISIDFVWESCMRNKHSDLWIENNFNIFWWEGKIKNILETHLLLYNLAFLVSFQFACLVLTGGSVSLILSISYIL